MNNINLTFDSNSYTFDQVDEFPERFRVPFCFEGANYFVVMSFSSDDGKIEYFSLYSDEDSLDVNDIPLVKSLIYIEISGNECKRISDEILIEYFEECFRSSLSTCIVTSLKDCLKF